MQKIENSVQPFCAIFAHSAVHALLRLN